MAEEGNAVSQPCHHRAARFLDSPCRLLATAVDNGERPAAIWVKDPNRSQFFPSRLWHSAFRSRISILRFEFARCSHGGSTAQDPGNALGHDYRADSDHASWPDLDPQQSCALGNTVLGMGHSDHGLVPDPADICVRGGEV